MITIVKRQREKKTYTQISVQDLVLGVQIGEYRYEPRKPRFRFAAENARRNGELGLILREKGFAYKEAKHCAKYNVSPL